MSSNVTVVNSPLDNADGGSIITHGRWHKQTRPLPQSLPQDGERQQPVNAEGTIIPTAGKEPSFKHSTDLVTTASPEEIKRCRKSFFSPEKSRRKQAEPHTMTLEALSAALASVPIIATSTTTKYNFSAPVNLVPSTAMPLVAPLHSDAMWREQLFPIFLSLHLPDEINTGCKRVNPQRPRNWLLNLPEAAPTESPVLETAMAALCMARIGRKTDNMPLVQHSLTLYTRSLRELQQAIRNPATRLLDQTLAATMTLSMYEVTECPSKRTSGYSSHQTGGLALLKMRGPDAHISPLGHSLFIFLRIQNFIESLFMRRSNFLSQDEWISRPWKTSSKDPHDRFMDQMYNIPVLLERTDRLAASGASRDVLLRGYQELIAEYEANYASLKRWCGDLQAAVAGPLYSPELSVIPCPIFDESGMGRPFPVAFHFPAFFLGQSMILFWLIAMATNIQIDHLYRRVAVLEGVAATSGSASSPPPPGSSLAAAAEAAAVARSMGNNICQSIEYFLQDGMGDIGSISMLLPLTVVRYNVVRREPDTGTPPGSLNWPNEHSDEVRWLDFLIQKVGHKGHRMAFYLDDD